MNRRPGFTVIEVVLFIAISTLLSVLLIVGTSVSIQRQQYKDAVQSYANFLQGEYEKVVSVQNDRPAGPCPITGGASTERGRSDCIIIGRYLMTTGATNNASGSDYIAYPVYALKTGASWQYKLGESDTNYSINWGARTRISGQSADSAHVAVLMYRDPEDGRIVTRANSGRYGTDNIGMFVQGKNTAGTVISGQFDSRELCVYDMNWLRGERLSVFLGQRTGSADAITVAPSVSGDCKGVNDV